VRRAFLLTLCETEPLVCLAPPKFHFNRSVQVGAQASDDPVVCHRCGLVFVTSHPVVQENRLNAG
jgi:hypothetical protein